MGHHSHLEHYEATKKFDEWSYGSHNARRQVWVQRIILSVHSFKRSKIVQSEKQCVKNTNKVI